MEEIGIKPKLDLKRYWDLSSSYYGRVEETFEDRLPKIVSGKILDWGCSIGFTSKELSILYPNCSITGLDISFFKKWPKEEKNISFVQGDGYFPPFKEETFDAVFCMNNLTLLLERTRDYNEFIKKSVLSIGSLVKPKGYLIFSDCDSWKIFQKESKNFKVHSHSDRIRPALDFFNLWLT